MDVHLLTPKRDFGGLQAAATAPAASEKEGLIAAAKGTREVAIEDLSPAQWEAVHADAAARGETTYADPATGYTVFTEVSHKKRGTCCGQKCRHCPYDYVNVKMPARRAQ